MTVIHIDGEMISAEATIKFDNDLSNMKMLAKHLLKERNEMYEMLNTISKINVPQEYLSDDEVECLSNIDELLAKTRGEQ